ncbi:Adhesin protein E (PE) [Canicola haemoglobinophilus]|uniref:Adhesin protein E (PE) n=1 Tax=Canicola haemoglobinophilus TaxID=733 RepID=A0AB38HBQ3_9PAST|nr:surface-adhesin E family protein [Canicola haemoglobinophilus]STO54720.1 Adhesin protein E (PE) [Canicola haemoglobinophilus]STO69708.1 Adhesin protein E (PE) [Canicola haemoglobinophilus]
MKKLGLIFSAILLSACAQQTTNDLKLSPPDIIKSGFIPLYQNSQEYIDTNSVQVDKSNKRLVHLDVVTNLSTAAFVYKEQPDTYAKSLRKHKTLNCENYILIHNQQTFYSEFWGEGLSTIKQAQPTQPTAIAKHSPLYTVGQVICEKLYRNW